MLRLLISGGGGGGDGGCGGENDDLAGDEDKGVGDWALICGEETTGAVNERAELENGAGGGGGGGGGG
jgi:hypothetical protein